MLTLCVVTPPVGQHKICKQLQNSNKNSNYVRMMNATNFFSTCRYAHFQAEQQYYRFGRVSAHMHHYVLHGLGWTGPHSDQTAVAIICSANCVTDLAKTLVLTLRPTYLRFFFGFNLVEMQPLSLTLTMIAKIMHYQNCRQHKHSTLTNLQSARLGNAVPLLKIHPLVESG